MQTEIERASKTIKFRCLFFSSIFSVVLGLGVYLVNVNALLATANGSDLFLGVPSGALIGAIIGLLAGYLSSDSGERITAKLTNFDLTAGIDVVAAQNAGIIRVVGVGQSITTVQPTFENLTNVEIGLILPIGVYFQSTGDHQNMVAREQRVFSVGRHESHTLYVAASCINANRPIPTENESFSGIEMVAPSVKSFLDNATELEEMAIQCGVWALTDNLTGDEISSRLFVEGPRGNRIPAINDHNIQIAKRVLQDLQLSNSL